MKMLSKSPRMASTAILGLWVAASAATAMERTLEFQLVTKLIDPKAVEAPNIEGRSVIQAKAFGVAVFKDGRMAVKDFVVVLDLDKGTGPFFGYSTYTFDDGSSVTARFTAQAKANEPTHGQYQILSGTGAYAGATGTGTFDSIPSQFKNADLVNVKLRIVTP
jgi:hypothetical protein